MVNIYNKALKSEFKYSVPAAIITAQACLESGYGDHIPNNSNNIFGIKAKKNQAYVISKTKEYIDDNWVYREEKFAKYKSINAALNAHAKLLSNNYKPKKKYN